MDAIRGVRQWVGYNTTAKAIRGEGLSRPPALLEGEFKKRRRHRTLVLWRPSDHEVEECHAVSKRNEHYFISAPTV